MVLEGYLGKIVAACYPEDSLIGKEMLSDRPTRTSSSCCFPSKRLSMCLWKRERTYLFLPFGTTLVRQPHYAGGRYADVDHLQDARSQGCEDDGAVCESDPKESASFVSTRLRPTAFLSIEHETLRFLKPFQF